jgi:hypothetical protein
MLSSSTFPYFCKINALSSTQSTGAGCNLLNQSRALPRRLSLAILKSLSALRSHTSAAIVSLSAQSVTSLCSRPQNNSSMPCGLVILQKRKDHRENYKTVQTQSLQKQKDNCNDSTMAYLLQLDPDLSKRNRRRTTLQTPIKFLHAQVTMVQS